MEYITINFPVTPFLVESRGVSVSVDPAKVPVALFATVIQHGIKQKISDAAANAARMAWKDIKGDDAKDPNRAELAEFVADLGKEKVETHTLALLEKALAGLYAGDWVTRQAGGTLTKKDGSGALAHDLARTDLIALFNAVCLKAGAKPTIKEAIRVGGDRIGAFFEYSVTATGRDSYKWIDAKLAEYIVKSKEGEKRDYLADAVTELERRAEAALSVDAVEGLDDMLGGL